MEKCFRYFIFLFLLFISMSTCKAQILDSLMQELVIQEDDTSRANTMIAVCSWASNNDGQLLDSMTQELMLFATKIDYPKGIAFALQFQGIVSYLNNDFSKADSLFQKASENFSMIGNRDVSVRSFIKSGIMNLMMGDFDTALAKFNQSIDTCQKYQLDKALAKALNEKATIYHYRNQEDSATYFYHQAIAKSETAQILEEKQRALYNLSVLLSDHNKPKEANISLQKLYQSQKEADNSIWAMGKTQHAIGENHRLMGDYPHAIESFLESANLLEKVGDQSLLVIVYSQLSGLYQEIQDSIQINHYVEKTIATLPDSGLLGGQIQALLNIAFVNQNQTKYDQALNIYDRAFINLAQNNMWGKMIFVLLQKSHIYQDQDDLYQAWVCLERADSLSLAQDPAIMRAEINLGYAKYYVGTKAYQKSLALALPIWDSLKNSSDFMGKRYYSQLLFQAYKGLNQHKEAFHFLELYHEYKDSLFNKSSVRKMAVAQYQGEKQSLIKQNEQQESLFLAEQKANESQRNAFIVGILALCFVILAFYRNFRIKQKANLELASRNEIIEEQKLGLQDLNEVKDHIFAILGHDLRKPALAFRGLSKKLAYLIRKEDYVTLQKIGTQLERDADSLYALTDNILQWALIQKSGYQYRPRTFDLRESVDEVVSIFDRAASIKGVELVSEIKTELLVSADPHAIQTVIRNLVDNALKYTSRGGHVHMKAHQVGENICLQVSDTGEGFSKEKEATIFSLSDKSKTGTAGEQGTGLGLHLVHSLVRKNQGELRVKSQLTVGTTFEVSLPAAS